MSGMNKNDDSDIVKSLEVIRIALALFENKLDSVQKSSEKTQHDLNSTKEILQQAVSNIAFINKDLKTVVDSCNNLNKTVILGNGTPPLKESIILLQNKYIDIHDSIKILSDTIDGVIEMTNNKLKEFTDKEKDEIKEDKRNKFELTLQSVGWIMVILGILFETLLNKIWK